MQVVFYLLATATIFFAIKKSSNTDKFIIAFLSFFWLWMGIVYHLLYFTTINKGAYVFGAAFILQGFLVGYAGIYTRKLSFNFRSDIYGVTGALFILYALILYPVLSYSQKHIYPSAPTFGLPCPTTIFTFGIYLWTEKKFPKFLLVIPILWAIVGVAAAFSLGVIEDFGLIISGVLTSILLIIRDRQIARMPINL